MTAKEEIKEEISVWRMTMDNWRCSHGWLRGEQCEICNAPKREWKGLTEEDRNDCLVSADPCETLADPEAKQLMEDVEAKLKAKNGY